MELPYCTYSVHSRHVLGLTIHPSIVVVAMSLEVDDTDEDTMLKRAIELSLLEATASRRDNNIDANAHSSGQKVVSVRHKGSDLDLNDEFLMQELAFFTDFDALSGANLADRNSEGNDVA